MKACRRNYSAVAHAAARYLRIAPLSVLVLWLPFTDLARCDTGAPSAPIRFSRVIEQLSKDPAFREKLLNSLDALPNAWGLIGANQRARLRNYILDRNWEGIDHFPGLTVAELRASVLVANTAANRYPSLYTKLSPPYVEVAPFNVAAGGEADWDPSPDELANAAENPVKDLGYGLTMGDPPHPELWKWHNRSVRAAFIFNRLALNRSLPQQKFLRVRLNGRLADSPEALLALLQNSGYDLWIEDARYFANFGHLHFRGQDVLMPFWLNTRLHIPQSKANLLVPVSHAEEEIRIRSAKGNADVSFYYGIDGMAEFRTMDTLDQYWVGKNVAHNYRGAQAVQVAGLLSEALKAYVDLHRSYPDLAFNGYYRLGVCQDLTAAIEYRMFGKVSLFPITHDPQYFRGQGEIDQLFTKIPNDRSHSKIDWFRVRGSLPAKELAGIRIPELRRNLELVEQSQTEGSDRQHRFVIIGSTLVILAAFGTMLYRLLRRRVRPT